MQQSIKNILIDGYTLLNPLKNEKIVLETRKGLENEFKKRNFDRNTFRYSK